MAKIELDVRPYANSQREYRLGDILVGWATWHGCGMYDLHYHADVPANRWPAVVSGIEAADYTMLACASDMVNTGCAGWHAPRGRETV